MPSSRSSRSVRTTSHSAGSVRSTSSTRTSSADRQGTTWTASPSTGNDASPSTRVWPTRRSPGISPSWTRLAAAVSERAPLPSPALPRARSRAVLVLDDPLECEPQRLILHDELPKTIELCGSLAGPEELLPTCLYAGEASRRRNLLNRRCNRRRVRVRLVVTTEHDPSEEGMTHRRSAWRVDHPRGMRTRRSGKVRTHARQALPR